MAKEVYLTENILYPNTQVKQKIEGCEMGENISPVMKFTGDIGVGVMEKMLINRPLQGRGAADMNMINAYYMNAWVCRNPSLYTASMPWTRRSRAGVPTLIVSTLSDYRRSHLVRFMTY